MNEQASHQTVGLWDHSMIRVAWKLMVLNMFHQVFMKMG